MGGFEYLPRRRPGNAVHMAGFVRCMVYAAVVVPRVGQGKSGDLGVNEKKLMVVVVVGLLLLIAAISMGATP